MQTEILMPLVTETVPRATYAPWLSKKATKYRLYRPFVVRITDPVEYPDGVVIIVPAGYITDFSSIPWYVWWLYPPGFSESREGSVIHDYLYSHLHWYYSKDFADRALVAMMKQQHASSWATRRFKWAVSFGGRGGWTYRNKTHLSIHWKTKYPLLKYPDDLANIERLMPIYRPSFVG